MKDITTAQALIWLFAVGTLILFAPPLGVIAFIYMIIKLKV